MVVVAKINMSYMQLLTCQGQEFFAKNCLYIIQNMDGTFSYRLKSNPKKYLVIDNKFLCEHLKNENIFICILFTKD